TALAARPTPVAAIKWRRFIGIPPGIFVGGLLGERRLRHRSFDPDANQGPAHGSGLDSIKLAMRAKPIWNWTIGERIPGLVRGEARVRLPGWKAGA
ncbi:hypothetical protein ABI028_15550, partial [Enterococcus faecium]|uniref:hypothetical protein n=1 Tax=Enterococcus faecium TaxID=1352 RepID=UPI003F42CF4E